MPTVTARPELKGGGTIACPYVDGYGGGYGGDGGWTGDDCGCISPLFQL
jgi:hypothetical protein